ncbi:Ethylene-responsive transcription factor Related to AP22-12 [Forsythia ovata]|uniref:Ethylene-responsive transcription factor Related to AP22-12 n=1 Tax=Forsythia ovata TaxID=205694 RepID=A0ABD1WSY6_9LAMI
MKSFGKKWWLSDKMNMPQETEYIWRFTTQNGVNQTNPPELFSYYMIVINISELLTLNRSSHKLTTNFQWSSSGGGADLINGKKKVPENYHSKPLRSKPVVDIDDDFEADF